MSRLAFCLVAVAGALATTRATATDYVQALKSDWVYFDRYAPNPKVCSTTVADRNPDSSSSATGRSWHENASL
mgnify:CR=1 FL=1